jgi:hypothetical protein
MAENYLWDFENHSPVSKPEAPPNNSACNSFSASKAVKLAHASSMYADETSPFNDSITTVDEDMPVSAARIGIEQIMPSMNDAPIPVGAAMSDDDDEHPPTEEADTEHRAHDGHPFDTFLVRACALDESSDSEKSVYIAEEVIGTPWWNQRRTLAVLVLFVVLAVTSSVAVIRSQSHFIGLTPTSLTSNAPTSSPAECNKRIYSSTQKIDLGGEYDYWNSAVAVDGDNMVVVATGVFGNCHQLLFTDR